MNVAQFETPLVAIMRGLTTAEAPAVGAALFEAGFRLLEVPLNRPGALEAIAILARMAPADALVGGGTILNVDSVDAVHEAGGRLLVAPNFNAAVVRRGAELGMLCAPGVATPTEAFNALDAGAHALKIFPAEMVGQGGLKAIKTVLPDGTPLWPVGGVAPEHIADWRKAGATGFGIGGQLYSPGLAIDELRARARSFVSAWRSSNH